MENQFTNFIAPFLRSIDSGAFFGRPFRWLYISFAVGNLLVPIVIMAMAIQNNVFDNPFKFGVTFFLIWIAIGLASWFGFQIWWNRANELANAANRPGDFVATPVMAHLIQTAGEWLGIWLAIVGTVSSLIGAIILGKSAAVLASQLGLDFLFGQSFLFVFVFPITGYLIIIFSRYLSEQIKALAAIANNTKKVKQYEAV